MLDCLQNLVGLTDKECACYTGTKPANFASLNASDSGYYLTDEDYGFPLLAALFSSIDCGDPDNIYNVLERARKAAINKIKTDLPTALSRYWDEAVPGFDGLVAKRSANGVTNPVNSFVGQLWRPVPTKGAYFTVNAFWLALDQAANVTLTIKSNDPDFADIVQPLAYTLTGGQFQQFTLATPIEIPFFSRTADSGGCCDGCGLRYVFSVELPTGVKPMNNTFYCCGGRPNYMRFLEAGGFDVASPETLVEDCTYTCSNAGYGLSIDGFISCDKTDWLCNLKQIGGLDMRDYAARLIQHASTEWLANHVLDSQELNFWTVLSREQVYGKRSHAGKRFEEMLLFMAQKLPPEATGCYKCKAPYVRRHGLG
jgi:hypothetical protein